MLAALRQSFAQELFSEIPRKLLELRRQPARQILTERLRRFLGVFVGLQLNLFKRARGLIGDFSTACRKLLFPLIKGEPSLGGNCLRSRFLRRSLNLLTRVGDEPGYLARQLNGSIGRARRGREHP